MGVGVAVVLVPDRGGIARIGFEEKLRHRIEPSGRLRADGTDLLGRCLIDRKLEFDDGAAFAALEIVAGHQSRSAAMQSAQTPQMAR